MKQRIAVYGILKQGEAAEDVLNGMFNTKFLGKCIIPKARLYEAPTAPWIHMDAENGYDVHAELYLADEAAMAMMDRMENHPYLYKRTVVPILHNGEMTEAQVYVFQHPIPDRGIENPNGNFTRNYK
jgi:gamma-glutamylcyclotransferase (GGCT)/AIG2-like uncharacterized protein YtfP